MNSVGVPAGHDFVNSAIRRRPVIVIGTSLRQTPVFVARFVFPVVGLRDLWFPSERLTPERFHTMCFNPRSGNDTTIWRLL